MHVPTEPITQHDTGNLSELRYSAEASSLGIRPGQWPTRIDVDALPGFTGPSWFGMPQAHTDGEGDLTHVVYYLLGNRASRIQLTVFND